MLRTLILVSALTTAVAASAAEGKYPIYRAMVIFTHAQGKSEQRETFGSFEALQECLLHAKARRNALIARKKVYDIEAFCLYQKNSETEPVLLK